MSVNYVQLENNLKPYMEKVKAHETQMRQLEQFLWEFYKEPGMDLDSIREIVGAAEKKLRRLYCAKPLEEGLLTRKPAPTVRERYALVAADGSQIAPNRHRSIPYCVVNVGLIKTRFGTGEAPEINILSELLDHDALFTPEDSLISEEDVGLYRDLAERQALLDFSPSEEMPVITLTDGPLDVYRNMQTLGQRKEIQARVMKLYNHLEARQVISAGYIDKPGSEMISRMLSLLKTPDETMERAEQKPALYGVSDVKLLKNLLTQPGERSAVFEAVTKSEGGTSLGVHFFYLNVGSEVSPYLARVEFPAWVSKFPEKVDLLHGAIVREVAVLDTHPYPYALHRAHELAVISFPEHDHVEQMLLQLYEQMNLEHGLTSNKDANKKMISR